MGLPDLELQLNSLGTPHERAAYRDELVAYLEAHHDQLDEDSRRRLRSNPLRILDSKNPQMRDLLQAAPSLMSRLGEGSKGHLDRVRAILDKAGVVYVMNPRLVRGLDYYSLTVFEWVSDRLGAQATVCAGGRYDGLVEQLGGRPTPAVGFAMGLERLVALLEESRPEAGAAAVDVYLVLLGDAAAQEGLILAEELRTARPDLRILSNCGGGGTKAQFKRADRSGARYALVMGDNELANGTVALKALRSDEPQLEVGRDQLGELLQARFAN
jgi:histidyl-tRNA synthetase